ncbi:DUF7518 family protein [Halobacterium jilantaiense]|uniref:Chromosome segregation protein SMC n=1 Tax=Halobacterium jilantaiense TaxID=355548 RepID=A0A1I0NW06_9EURY|nr:hypothetical protein [Halobacterium jilantaiense]SEW06009.1 hypothetical protein SAMN04487945_1200 [Halobacterium jilantaiense]
MSDDDRVDELEDRVAELEATVRGLTEELVDASERIRTLEGELDRTPSTSELREAREEEPVTPAGEADEAPKTAEDEATDNEESGLDDIIVA